MVGMGRGAQAGVLIRNAEALERMEKVNTLVIDKTGTLTEGRPSVVRVASAEDVSAEDVVRFAASVEQASEHPLSEAIVAAAKKRFLSLSPVDGFDAPAGKGVVGTVEGPKVRVGSAAFLTEAGVDVGGLAAGRPLRTPSAGACPSRIRGQRPEPSEKFESSASSYLSPRVQCRILRFVSFSH